MTSTKRAGRIATFGFAVGAGLLIAAGAGAATAAAAPESSAHTPSGSSSAQGHSTSTARSARPATKVKASRTVSTGNDKSAPVVQLNVKRPVPAATTSPSVTMAAVPSAKDTAPSVAPMAKQPAAPRIPTPTEAATNAMRDLNTLRRNIEILVQHQVDDWRHNIAALRADLQAIFGPARRPTNPDIPADESPGVIGKPRTREGYFIYQGDTNTCSLSMAAMLIGQIYGRDKMPTWEQIVNEAATTPSYSKPGQPIYDRVKDTFVSDTDVIQLLATRGVTAVDTTYTRGQGDLAYSNLKAALTRDDAVAVTVKADILWGRGAPSTAYTSDHFVVVLGIDTAKGVVYVNDSAWEQPKGMGQAIPLDLFMHAWAADRYNTLTAVAATDQQSALAA